MIRILRRKGLGNTSTKAIKEFSTHDIEIIRNDRNIPEDTTLLIRWGCTSRMPSQKTLNKASAISKIANKYKSRVVMREAGVSIPKLYDQGEIKFPVIVRPHYHSQGKYLWLCNNQEELDLAFQDAASKGKLDLYVSEYIKKDKEYGVFIFDGRVTSVISKEAKQEGANAEVAWNVSQGTHSFKNVRWSNWPINVCIEALKANKSFDATFSRVDVIVKDNVPYILELNSAHSLTSEYRQKTFTKCLDYYIDNGPVQKELEFSQSTTYKSIIHPALRVNGLGKNL